ncbi:MAG TPA: SRPBCC family protein [Prolixibacteraceae bacterium]|jgi:hypothetical protein
MKILKFLLIGVVAILALILVIALFTKKEYGVVREVTINKPKSVVFEYVKFLKNQENFSVWANKDPAMKKDYRGTDGTVGFVSSWESKMKDVGKGEQEIKKIIEGERIDYELRFFEPYASTDQAFITFEGISDTQTKVKWGFSGRMKYPMNLFLLTMDMEGMIGKDFQDGLNNLKAILEK